MKARLDRFVSIPAVQIAMGVLSSEYSDSLRLHILITSSLAVTSSCHPEGPENDQARRLESGWSIGL